MSVARGAVTHLNLIKCMKIQVGECSFSSKHLPNQVGNCFFRWEFAAIGKKLRKHFENFFLTCKKIFIFSPFLQMFWSIWIVHILKFLNIPLIFANTLILRFKNQLSVRSHINRTPCIYSLKTYAAFRNMVLRH